MNIDIRKIICATMIAMNSKTRTRIISWDYVRKYIEILETKYNTNINIIYEDDFNEEQYDKLITTISKNRNIYIILNNNFPSKHLNSLIDKELVLSKDESIELINCTTSNIDYEFIKKYRLKEILKKIPKDNIQFAGIFKLFMLRYSQKINNKIDKNSFWQTIFSLEKLLNKYGIEIQKCSKLELLRILSNPHSTCQQYNISDTHIEIEILDINNYCQELAKQFNNESFIFTIEIIDWIIEYKFRKNNELQKRKTLN